MLGLEEKARLLVTSSLTRAKDKLALMAGRADALSPLSILKRGYSVAEKDGRVVTTVCELDVDTDIGLTFSDGSATARITDIIKEK